MDGQQFKYLIRHDKMLCKLGASVILEHELTVIKANHIYIILVKGRERRGDRQTDRRTIYGHWVLCETIFESCCGYFDPLSMPPSSFVHEKILHYCAKFNAKFILNKRVYQLGFSNICGAIIAYVLLCRARGISYKKIRTQKLHHSPEYLVKILPEFIRFFLPKRRNKIVRFTYDTLMA